MAYKQKSPIVVKEGGTGITTATAYAPVVGGTTATGPFQSASTGIANNGYVLTSNGAAALPTWQASGGSAGGGSIMVVYGRSGVWNPTGLAPISSPAVYYHAALTQMAWFTTTGIGSQTESNMEFPAPFDCILDRMYLTVGANSSPIDMTLTVRVNGVNSALAVTVTALTTGLFTNLVDSASVTAGDPVTIAASAPNNGNSSPNGAIYYRLRST